MSKLKRRDIEREELKKTLLNSVEKMQFMLKLREKVMLDSQELFSSKIKWSHLRTKNVFVEKIPKYLETKSV